MATLAITASMQIIVVLFLMAIFTAIWRGLYPPPPIPGGDGFVYSAFDLAMLNIAFLGGGVIPNSSLTRAS